jgi:GT2 family glycosyltransferase
VAAAAGGCILVRRELLEKIGGLASMHDAIIDDVTLARKVKSAGGRCWLGSEDEMLSLRGYTTLGEIIDMVARTAFTELRYHYSLVAVTWIALGLFFLSPPLVSAVALWLGNPLAGGVALLTWCLQAAALAPVARHLRVPLLWSALLPFASAVYGAMTTISAWRHFRGRGIVWRGRTWKGSRGRGV